MLSLAIFCLFYLAECHQCSGEITISEGTCDSKDGACFSFQFDTLESLREKLKRDADLRAVLERFVQVERQLGGGTSECLYTGASQTSTPISQPDKGDTTTASDESNTSLSQPTRQTSTFQLATTTKTIAPTFPGSTTAPKESETTSLIPTPQTSISDFTVKKPSKSTANMKKSETTASKPSSSTLTSDFTTTVLTELTPGIGLNESATTASKSSPISTSELTTTPTRPTHSELGTILDESETTSSKPTSPTSTSDRNSAIEPILPESNPDYYKCFLTTATNEQECDPDYYNCLTTTAKADESQDCKRNWWNIGSSCVRFSERTATYNEAKPGCVELNGRLAAETVRNGTMANCSNFVSFMSESKSDKFWIGLERPDKENWEWSDSCTYIKDKTNWDEKQPGDNEHCALLMNTKKGWKIHDYPCNQDYLYICEKINAPGQV